MIERAWRKSSRSASAAQCVELAIGERVAVDDDAIEAERRLMIAEATQVADDMFRYPFQLAFRAAFGDRGYGLPPGGLPETLRAIGAADFTRSEGDKNKALALAHEAPVHLVVFDAERLALADLHASVPAELVANGLDIVLIELHDFPPNRLRPDGVERLAPGEDAGAGLELAIDDQVEPAGGGVLAADLPVEPPRVVVRVPRRLVRLVALGRVAAPEREPVGQLHHRVLGQPRAQLAGVGQGPAHALDGRARAGAKDHGLTHRSPPSGSTPRPAGRRRPPRRRSG